MEKSKETNKDHNKGLGTPNKIWICWEIIKKLEKDPSIRWAFQEMVL